VPADLMPEATNDRATRNLLPEHALNLGVY
jgi:hypothetical protein